MSKKLHVMYFAKEKNVNDNAITRTLAKGLSPLSSAIINKKSEYSSVGTTYFTNSDALVKKNIYENFDLCIYGHSGTYDGNSDPSTWSTNKHQEDHKAKSALFMNRICCMCLDTILSYYKPQIVYLWGCTIGGTVDDVQENKTLLKGGSLLLAIETLKNIKALDFVVLPVGPVDGSGAINSTTEASDDKGYACVVGRKTDIDGDYDIRIIRSYDQKQVDQLTTTLENGKLK